MGRRRELGRISEQARDYIKLASPEVAQELRRVFEDLKDVDLAEQISFDAIEHESQFGRQVTLLSNGHIVAWREFVDRRDRYAVFYIGPAGLF